MARRKNVKRIDPRYFLHETVNRGEELEEWVDGGAPDQYAGDYAQSPGEKRREADRYNAAAKADRKKGAADANDARMARNRARDKKEKDEHFQKIRDAKNRARAKAGKPPLTGPLYEEELEEAEFQDTGFGEEDIEVNRAAATGGFEEMQAQQKILDAVVAAAVEAVGDWIDDEDSRWPQPGSFADRETFLKELDAYSQTYAGVSVADVLGKGN